MAGAGQQIPRLVLEGCRVLGVLRGRVGALDPVVHGLRQHVRGRLAQQGLLPAVEGLQRPGSVVHVLDEPVVAEGDTDLQADGHARAVLAVEQDAHEAGQVQMADPPHPVLDVALTVQAPDAGHGVAVAVGHVRGQIQLRRQVGAQHIRVLSHVTAHRHQPGERVGAAGLLVEELQVSAEDLVGGLAGQGHDGVVADRPEEQVQGGVHVAEAGRQVPGADDLGADLGIGEGPGVQHDVLVVGARGAGDVVGEGSVGGAPEFVGDEVLGLPREVHGEAADLLTAFTQLPGGERGHRGGVQPAGEQGAAGHVGDELAAHDVVEERADVLDRGVPAVGVRTGLQLPVAAPAQARAVDRDDGAGFDLTDAVPDGVTGRLDHGEKFPQTVEPDPAAGQRMGKDRLGLGAEQHAVRGRMVVERLDAHAVADHDELVLAAVPQREGVHAVEALGERVTPFEVAAQHHLRVGSGGETMPPVREFTAEFGEVVGLSRVDERDRAVGGFGAHRLPAAGQVDDGEPAVAERRGPLRPDAAVVRPTAGHRLGHRIQGRPLGAEIAGEGDPAGDAAHTQPPESGPPGDPATTSRFATASASTANQL